jgi:hypothetical protein
MAGTNCNGFPPPRKSPTGTVIKIYAVALIVALVFFIRGHALFRTQFKSERGSRLSRG